MLRGNKHDMFAIAQSSYRRDGGVYNMQHARVHIMRTNHTHHAVGKGLVYKIDIMHKTGTKTQSILTLTQKAIIKANISD